MLELPATPAPNGVSVTQVDYGITQRSAAGGPVLRYSRPGNRYAAQITFPIMDSETAKVFVSRLQRGINEIIRIEFPLLGVSQGSPGSLVVDGANPEGTSLPVRGGTANYFAKEGYWLNLVDADGAVYLHNVTEPLMLNAAGKGTLKVWPPIRAMFADGAAVLMGKPFIEGYVTDIGYDMILGNFVQLSFSMEEAA